MSATQTHTRVFKRLLSQSTRHGPVLYADKALIVLNKPSGIVCQSSKNPTHENNLNGILEDVRSQLGLKSLPLQVHRLDKYTTGALLLAKLPVHAHALAQQFQLHTIKKTYLAIVRGGRQTFPSSGRGTINQPLRIDADGVQVDEHNGSPALTDWELLGSSETAPLSLLKLVLHSGLKHQLRVHLAKCLGAPVLGDSTYSTKPPLPKILNIIPSTINVWQKGSLRSDDRSSSSFKSSSYPEPRVFLHASQICMTRYRPEGPKKRFTLNITVPLPDDFITVCKRTGLDEFLRSECVTGDLQVDGKSVPFDETIEGINGRWMV